VSRDQLLAYYQSYAAQMKIEPVLGTEVVQVRPEGSQWEVTARDGRKWRADRVVVCTGFNRRPYVPSWPGLEASSLEVLHSRDYRNGAPYRGKKVLVVGMGNTGAELAIDLHEHGAQPYISVRGPVNIILRDVFGRPTQLTAMALRKLPFWLGDAIGSLMSRLTVGDLRSYGIRRPRMAPARQLRELGRTPVIDVGTVRLIREGHIRILPGIRSVAGQEITFEDGRQIVFDAVVLATGYRAAVEAFVEDAAPLLNEHHVPAALWSDARPGLYFLGFDAYSSGILNSIYQDSEKILHHMQHQQASANIPAPIVR
jgi:NADPH-dependent 2,4-dienoyl-CoA reductase/sulfur reductase-like enzyme